MNDRCPSERAVSAWGAGVKEDCMIRIVASDMDGTLLDEDGNVPVQTYDLVRRLDEAGIRFVVSSGRRYDTLQEFFAPVVDRMDFVASNGAQVYVRGKLVDLEIFSHASVRRLNDIVGMFDGLHLALFDRNITYLMDDEACFERELDKNLPHPVRAEDVPSADTTIIKASIYCDDALMDMAYVLERELGDEFTFAPSGHKWIDVMRRGVSKATGINQVLRAHGLRADELMAFGDAMNDYEILRMAGTSVAMGNGRSAIKEIATKVIGTNAQNSVQEELEALLDSRASEAKSEVRHVQTGGNAIKSIRAHGVPALQLAL